MLLKQRVRATFDNEETPGAPSGDRRRAERQETRQGAYVSYQSGRAKQYCQILDFSEKGARLRLADTMELPKVFQLHTVGGDAYLCELKRRKPDHVGVEFLHRA